jgi:hypothetical protein
VVHGDANRQQQAEAPAFAKAQGAGHRLSSMVHGTLPGRPKGSKWPGWIISLSINGLVGCSNLSNLCVYTYIYIYNYINNHIYLV